MLMGKKLFILLLILVGTLDTLEGWADNHQGNKSPASYRPDVTFTLKTAIAEGKLAYIGVGGAIEGIVNPALKIDSNAVVQITLVNGDGAEHDIVVPNFSAKSDHVVGKGSSAVIVFRANKNGSFAYFCSIPGHRQAGMEGQISVGPEQ